MEETCSACLEPANCLHSRLLADKMMLDIIFDDVRPGKRAFRGSSVEQAGRKAFVMVTIF